MTSLGNAALNRRLPERFPYQVFFCKYNDPIYVKMEKLDVLVMLCSDANVDQVMSLAITTFCSSSLLLLSLELSDTNVYEP